MLKTRTSCWMTSVAKIVVVALVGLLLTGCGEQIETFGGPTMGSHYSLKYVPGAATPAPEALKALVEEQLDQIDQQLSTWRNDSIIVQFNQLPAGSCLAVPAAILELVVAGQQLSASSAGAFDLTLQPLLELWGFGYQSRKEQIPTPEQIAAVKQNIGQHYLRIEGQQLCKDVALQVDFNSIAAGYSVDLVGAHLRELGVNSYLLDITGELKGVGRKPDGSHWHIAIEAPRDDQQVAQKVLALDDQAVSTSGDYRNYFEQAGQRYSHTLDPQTGAPITHNLASVTVVDPSTLRADGLSTLLMVLGPQRGFDFAEQNGVAAFFVTRAGQGFATKGTSAFNRQFGEGVTQ